MQPMTKNVIMPNLIARSNSRIDSSKAPQKEISKLPSINAEQYPKQSPPAQEPTFHTSFEKKKIPSVLSAEDLKILREFKTRELEKRRLNFPISPNIARLSDEQMRCLKSCILDSKPVPKNRPKSSKASIDFVLDREHVLYDQFVQFSAGTVAFKSSAKIFKVSRFGIESKEERVAFNQGLLSSDGKRGVTLDLRECLEFCKSVGIVPVIAGPENDRNLKVFKTDVSSVEYALVVSTFKEVENVECELDFERFTQFLYTLFTKGLDQLDRRLHAALQKRTELQQRMTKYLQSTPNPHKRITEIFEEVFSNVYEAFVFFDIEGVWNISAATFMHLCKNVLCLPLTAADLKLTLEEIGWLQNFSAHDFVQGFAWHTLEEKRIVPRSGIVQHSETEAALYQGFCYFAQYRPKGLGGAIPSSAEVGAFGASSAASCPHVSFQQYVEFLKFAGIVPTRTVRIITGETLQKTDVGSPEYDVAVKAFRSTVEREDLMEWIEFKECLFHTIRGGGITDFLDGCYE